MGPLRRPAPADTDLRNATLWEMRRLLDLRVGGTWDPFQEKPGVYGLRRRIPLYRDLAFYVGIAVRSSLYRFDMIRPAYVNAEIQEGEDERRSHTYQVFVYTQGRGFGYNESRPRVIFTTATMPEAVLKLTGYVNSMRRLLSRI